MVEILAIILAFVSVLYIGWIIMRENSLSRDARDRHNAFWNEANKVRDELNTRLSKNVGGQ